MGKTLILMSGVAGSGKSTYANKQLNCHNCIVVSRDRLRDELRNATQSTEYFPVSDAKEMGLVYDRLNNAIFKCTELDLVDTVIYDATLLSPNSVIKLLKGLDNKYLWRFDTIKIVCIKKDLDTCLSQNALRDGYAKVPVSVLRRQFYQYDLPDKLNELKQLMVDKKMPLASKISLEVIE